MIISWARGSGRRSKRSNPKFSSFFSCSKLFKASESGVLYGPRSLPLCSIESDKLGEESGGNFQKKFAARFKKDGLFSLLIKTKINSKLFLQHVIRCPSLSLFNNQSHFNKFSKIQVSSRFGSFGDFGIIAILNKAIILYII